ncbi:SUMF1/EgtB/PvdO family nonheme iron enzyme [Scytonema sp. UIC 10036]|uniref:formylglycine-generating enzyme family protein n=1 Tax=Scytonema sp. UIC 10036 TaxID=2304196 RepID=UPI0012DAD20E|nr:formylglycine-generating enzyme family protein [Scytonema sp. UIC 10036]MUG94787.1 SUMF1/EgtB/PvdO family nonheme iron enzyme [Scytonema sp. UIC 10036]
MFSVSTSYTATQEQWQKVADFLPRVNRDLNPRPSRFKGERLPVESISWFDAVEFCDRLSKKTGRMYRLPTEAEWEYACRAGTKTPFYFGNTITAEVANYDGNAPEDKWLKKSTEVGSFPANDFCLHDMHGNVWEWCLDDWHESYGDAPTDGSAWITDNNEYRLLRGGSWSSDPEVCRSAYRLRSRSDNDNVSIGFRVVAVPSATEKDGFSLTYMADNSLVT